MNGLAPELQTLSRSYPWFKSLMDGYAFMDAALDNELRRVASPPVCAAGCGTCCRQPVPLTTAEAMGIRLFLLAGLAPLPEKDRESEWHCPFLHQGKCAVYAVRPFACRRFFVFSRPCYLGEDATVTRPGDVHKPSANALLHALGFTLPALRMAGAVPDREGDRDFFTRNSTLLQYIPWGTTQ